MIVMELTKGLIVQPPHVKSEVVEKAVVPEGDKGGEENGGGDKIMIQGVEVTSANIDNDGRLKVDFDFGSYSLSSAGKLEYWYEVNGKGIWRKVGKDSTDYSRKSSSDKAFIDVLEGEFNEAKNKLNKAGVVVEKVLSFKDLYDLCHSSNDADKAKCPFSIFRIFTSGTSVGSFFNWDSENTLKLIDADVISSSAILYLDVKPGYSGDGFKFKVAVDKDSHTTFEDLAAKTDYFEIKDYGSSVSILMGKAAVLAVDIDAKANGYSFKFNSGTSGAADILKMNKIDEDVYITYIPETTSGGGTSGTMSIGETGYA